jgi:signal transduction histidine kinase
MAIPSVATEVGPVAGQSREMEFLPILGHDLRSPLTALKGRLQLLQKRMSRQGDRDTDLADLESAIYHVERMNHQLDLVRDASQIANGQFALAPLRTDLNALLQRAATSFRSRAARGRVTLDLPEYPLVGQWDGERLCHAVTAVIANAIRFGPEGGEVEVRAFRTGEWACIEVLDEGIGVPDGERDLIFQLGARASNAERRGGPGLGLYVAREVVQRHGGAIGVNARSGGGAIFRLTLPLEPRWD